MFTQGHLLKETGFCEKNHKKLNKNQVLWKKLKHKSLVHKIQFF